MSSDGSSSANSASIAATGFSREANTNLSTPINASNSFYASFKIYINRFSGGGSQTSKAQPKTTLSSASSSSSAANNACSTKSKLPTSSVSQQKSQIVRIERIECDEDTDEVFFETPQNVEVHIKVDPPKSSAEADCHRLRENSPVFYLEPDDWSDEVVPKVVTSPTRALSPCGCGKSHSVNHKTGKMAALPEEPAMQQPPNYLKSSSSGSYLPLPSPRAAIMSELAQQNRQRKVTIPLLNSPFNNRAVRKLKTITN